MRATSVAVLALILSSSIAQAQRVQDPATTQKIRELKCREQAARDMQKPVQLPAGAVRAWEVERVERERLCLKQAAEADEAKLTSHRYYTNSDGYEVHSPTTSKNGQVPTGASAKCRDGTYSFSQHRRGTCSHHGGVGIWF